MRQISEDKKEILGKLKYLTGSSVEFEEVYTAPAKKIFDDEITEFLNALSKCLLSDRDAKRYSDVVTYAFWIRKANLESLKERYTAEVKRLGRGLAFHIAPSNVPVNFAYSMTAGLLSGNKNIVRIPAKDFAQTKIIIRAINDTLEKYPEMKKYICLVRYGHEKEINDVLSELADIRIIWGGDATIRELRGSLLSPGGVDITFADRYSFALIDTDAYMEIEDKKRVAQDFYNDTYFSDQNACTSPMAVVWTGSRKAEAKQVFWDELHALVEEKYRFEDIQFVNKQTAAYRAAMDLSDVSLIHTGDQLITRVFLSEINADCMKYKENSGFFFEYDCDDIMKLRDLADDGKCQTVGVIGEKAMLLPLIESGVRGIDRIVPVGHTMDFDLIWDGYDLVDMMSRRVKL